MIPLCLFVLASWLIPPLLCWRAEAQLAIFSDMHIFSDTAMHIAFEETQFMGGKITTARNQPEGHVSFAKGANWVAKVARSYVDGFVRIYHEGKFTFPLGNDGVFAPITVNNLSNANFLQMSYQRYPIASFLPEKQGDVISEEHFWLWSRTSASAQIEVNQLTNFNLPATLLLNYGTSNSKAKLGFARLAENQWHFFPIKTNILSDFVNNQDDLLHEVMQSVGSINFNTDMAISFSLRYENESEPIISELVTPNFDNINDNWELSEITFNTDSETTILNEKGEIVFIATGIYENNWPSTQIAEGTIPPDGFYYYKIDLDGNGESEYNGFFLLKSR